MPARPCGHISCTEVENPTTSSKRQQRGQPSLPERSSEYAALSIPIRWTRSAGTLTVDDCHVRRYGTRSAMEIGGGGEWPARPCLTYIPYGRTSPTSIIPLAVHAKLLVSVSLSETSVRGRGEATKIGSATWRRARGMSSARLAWTTRTTWKRLSPPRSRDFSWTAQIAHIKL